MAARRQESEPDATPDTPASVRLPALSLAPFGRAATAREVASEMPTALSYNGVAHVVMMTTPQDFEDFAVGFTLSEGIVESVDEISAIDLRSADAGMLVDIRIPQARFEALLGRRRNLVGQSGCGICGLEELGEALRPLPPLDAAPVLDREAAARALDALRGRQPLNAATGAVHAAAFCDASGAILAAREDVGRHNAFDKLIGHMARAGLDPSAGFALLSSRCSYELVQKAVAARIPALVTISAPTALAIRLAREARLTLIALARADSMLCFCDPHGLFGEAG